MLLERSPTPSPTFPSFLGRRSMYPGCDLVPLRFLDRRSDPLERLCQVD